MVFWEGTPCSSVGTATDHEVTPEEEVMAVCGGVRGTAGCSIADGRSDKLACYYTQTENIQAFRVAARKQMQCANAFRLGSNNSSFLTKSAHAHLSHF
jgi:hypothetical protein